MTDKSERVLMVPAFIDTDGEDRTTWCAHVPFHKSPFAGLFAWGGSFTEARETLAKIVWTAFLATPQEYAVVGLDPKSFDAVRIMAITRKTYPVESLIEAA